MRPYEFSFWGCDDDYEYYWLLDLDKLFSVGKPYQSGDREAYVALQPGRGEILRIGVLVAWKQGDRSVTDTDFKRFVAAVDQLKAAWVGSDQFSTERRQAASKHEAGQGD